MTYRRRPDAPECPQPTIGRGPIQSVNRLARLALYLGTASRRGRAQQGPRGRSGYVWSGSSRFAWSLVYVRRALPAAYAFGLPEQHPHPGGAASPPLARPVRRPWRSPLVPAVRRRRAAPPVRRLRRRPRAGAVVRALRGDCDDAGAPATATGCSSSPSTDEFARSRPTRALPSARRSRRVSHAGGSRVDAHPTPRPLVSRRPKRARATVVVLSRAAQADDDIVAAGGDAPRVGRADPHAVAVLRAVAGQAADRRARAGLAAVRHRRGARRVVRA